MCLYFHFPVTVLQKPGIRLADPLDHSPNRHDDDHDHRHYYCCHHCDQLYQLRLQDWHRQDDHDLNFLIFQKPVNDCGSKTFVRIESCDVPNEEIVLAPQFPDTVSGFAIDVDVELSTISTAKGISSYSSHGVL